MRALLKTSPYTWSNSSNVLHRQKTGLPIYQIPVPAGKIIIANTPEVLRSGDKHPKAVAFIPIAARVIDRLSGLSALGSKILLDKTVGEDRWDG